MQSLGNKYNVYDNIISAAQITGHNKEIIMDDTIFYKEISDELLGYLMYNLSSFKAAKETPKIKNTGMFVDMIFNTKTGIHTFQARHVHTLNEQTVNDIAVCTATLCNSANMGTLGENEFTMVLVFDTEFAGAQQTIENAKKFTSAFNTFTGNLYYPKKPIMMYEYSMLALFPYCP